MPQVIGSAGMALGETDAVGVGAVLSLVVEAGPHSLFLTCAVFTGTPSESESSACC